jgi:hypothetical protein
MEFALTRKQLNKKREKEEAAAQAVPAAAPAPTPPTGPTPGSDPLTGLPAGYDPSPLPPPTTAGSEFFGSSSNVFGHQAPPAPDLPPASSLASASGSSTPDDLLPPPVRPAPAGSPIPGFADFPAVAAPPPAPSSLGGEAAVPAAFGGAPLPAPSAPEPAQAPASDRLIDGARPRGGQLLQSVGRRYAGFAALLLAAILMVAFLPSLRGSVTNGAAAGPGPVASQVTYLPGQTHMNAPYSAGTTVGGVTCGSNVRQISWSAYAPACEPKWTGNNGGATAPGVTGTTITLSYRNAAAALMQEIYAVEPATITGTNDEFVQTMRAYLNVFNKDFELYGRHVVLTQYDGQGSFIDEDSGQGGPQAQADAITVATSLHAFADMSLASSTFVYDQDLSAQKVIAFGLYQQDAQYYQQNAPYAYTPGPNCSKSAESIGALFGQQLKGLPAQFAKGGLQTQTRKIGLIYENSATQAACEQQAVQALAKYGVTPASQAAIAFNYAQLQTESETAMSQMKQAGVTTVICIACDPVSTPFYFGGATAENYYPEWYFQPVFSENATDNEVAMRLLPANQAQDIIGTGVPDSAPNVAEAVKAFNLGKAAPTDQIVPEYQLVYGSMMMFFSALQAAGPNLTPQNFQAAMKAIPQSSPGGELGGWNGNDGPYDVASSFEVLKWDTTVASAADGKKGTWETCNNGNAYPFDNTASFLPTSTQLTCKVTPQVPTQLGTVPS